METAPVSYSSKYCVVPQCKNTKRNAPHKTFFSVPSGAKIRAEWCKVIGRKDVSPTTTLHCCQDHFNLEEDIDNYVKFKIMREQGVKVTLRLKKGVVPHKFHCREPNVPQPATSIDDIKKKRLALIEEAIADSAKKSAELENCSEKGSNTSQIKQVKVPNKVKPPGEKVERRTIKPKPKPPRKRILRKIAPKSDNVSTPPVLLLTQNPTVTPFLPVVLPLNYEPSSNQTPEDDPDNEQFQNEIRNDTLTAIAKDPTLFLGLSLQSYNLVKLLSEKIPLPTINIIISLRKIKLNESFSTLAMNFGYSQSDTSTIFFDSIPVIAQKMKDFIIWPTPPNIHNSDLSVLFKIRYENVISIIDCLEIEIETPENDLYRFHTWSEPQNKNTLKYLISYTPEGLVNFVSNGYGGKTTDATLVKDCSFLECLPPNKEVIMPDKSIKDVTCLFQTKKCTLIPPPSDFKISPPIKIEMDQLEEEEELAAHVQRIINSLQEFELLKNTTCMEFNLISVIDEIVTVACGLINVGLQSDLIQKLI